jgi:hypothetical protein
MNKRIFLYITLSIFSLLSINAQKLYLTGGNWKLQRASEVFATGEQLSQAGFNDDKWINATVPEQSDKLSEQRTNP